MPARGATVDGSGNGVGPQVHEHTVVGTAAWVARDQFVYFVTMERELGVPADWPVFRDGLVAALTAAFGLDTIWQDLPADLQRRRVEQRLAAAYQLVDAVRTHHNPDADWDAFFDALWAGRDRLRPPS